MKWEEIFKNYAIDTLEFIKNGKDLAITQGSLYIQELIKWEIYKNSGLAVCFLIGAIASVLCAIQCNKLRYKDKYDEHDLEKSAVVFFSSCLGIIFFCFAIASSLDALKAYSAPRVVIMEKMERLIK